MESDPKPSLQGSNTAHEHNGHVMISYQWDSQTRVIMIRDKLRQAGYSVWMDLDHMRKCVVVYQLYYDSIKFNILIQNL